MELKQLEKLKLYKLYDEPSNYVYIITTLDDKCYSATDDSIRGCIKTIGNPSGYYANKTVYEMYKVVSFKECLCTFKNPDDLIELIPEEFL